VLESGNQSDSFETSFESNLSQKVNTVRYLESLYKFYTKNAKKESFSKIKRKCQVKDISNQIIKLINLLMSSCLLCYGYHY
jgi:hypothetical protein